MKPLSQLVCDTLVTGALATAATSVTMALCGKAEGMPAVAPFNAVSHILYGDRAATIDEARADTTAPGFALNAAAMGLWAGVHDALFGEKSKHDLGTALLAGAATSAAAYIVDYYVVPKRLTPGFELRLSGGSMLAIYGALAVALAIGTLLEAKE